jgi:hypothetical protein
VRESGNTEMHQPFAIEFDLATPIIMDRGIGLPGLLARVIADAGDPDPLPKVPLAAMDGIFAGSDLFILGPSLDYHVAYVRSLRPTAMPHDLALREVRGGRPRSQITLRDEWKNLLDARDATSAATLVAFGAGDLVAVLPLLDGLTNIGAKRSSGYGVVATVRALPIEHPHAGFADRAGNSVRPVLVDVWRRMNLPPRPARNIVARLPRWASRYEPCVGPREQTIEADAYEREVTA